MQGLKPSDLEQLSEAAATLLDINRRLAALEDQLRLMVPQALDKEKIAQFLGRLHAARETLKTMEKEIIREREALREKHRSSVKEKGGGSKKRP